MLDSMFADTPFGYTERIYRCPQADHSLYHEAAMTVSPLRLHLNEHGDPYCERCGARLYADTNRKVPYALSFVVREEWL